ncbi:hypothetical protein RI367_007342 [Sorochytrium milnesiophthora]
MLALLLLLAGCGYCVHRLVRPASPKHRLPPSPKSVLLLDHLPLLASHPDVPGLLERLAEQLGPIFHLQLGDMCAIVINDEATAREAMVKQGAKFAGRWSLQTLWELSNAGQSPSMQQYKILAVPHTAVTQLRSLLQS